MNEWYIDEEKKFHYSFMLYNNYKKNIYKKIDKIVLHINHPTSSHLDGKLLWANGTSTQI